MNTFRKDLSCSTAAGQGWTGQERVSKGWNMLEQSWNRLEEACNIKLETGFNRLGTCQSNLTYSRCLSKKQRHADEAKWDPSKGGNGGSHQQMWMVRGGTT